MIIHADNFSLYGRNIAYMLNNIYAEIGIGTGRATELVDDPDGVSPGTVMHSTRNNDNGTTPWRYASPFGANAKMGAASRWWLPNLPQNNAGLTVYYSFRNGANNPIAELFVNSTGGLTVNIPGVGQFSTATPVISANGWYHVEMMVNNIAVNTVAFEVRVEGVSVLLNAGVVIPGGAVDVLPAQIAGSRNNISNFDTNYTKDLVLWDGQGGSNTDFLGSVLVANLDPTADAALNWTPSTGADGWEILDNRPPDDTKYISAGTPPPAAYVAVLSDLPLNVTSVKCVMTCVRAGKSDGGDATLQDAIVSGGVAGLGAARPITVTPTYWRDFFANDPATGAAWTPAAVNAASLQINRTA